MCTPNRQQKYSVAFNAILYALLALMFIHGRYESPVEKANWGHFSTRIILRRISLIIHSIINIATCISD
jgi:hypothetical protein